MTAIANDYGVEEVFSQQVRAHGRPGDVLLLLSTSGTIPNLLAAAQTGQEGGLTVWALTGQAPSPLTEASDQAMCVDAEQAATVQECHLVAVHLLCAALDVPIAEPAIPTDEEISSARRLVVVGDVLLLGTSASGRARGEGAVAWTSTAAPGRGGARTSRRWRDTRPVGNPGSQVLRGAYCAVRGPPSQYAVPSATPFFRCLGIHYPQRRTIWDDAQVEAGAAMAEQAASGATRRVDEFLELRAQDSEYPAEAHALLILLVHEYRSALNENKWPKCTALGEVMIKTAGQFKEHPDYVEQWEQP